MRNVRKKDVDKILDVYGEITKIVSPILNNGIDLINQSNLINQATKILLLETASQGYGYGTEKIINNSLGNIDLILELNNNELANPGNGMLPGEEKNQEQDLGDPVPYDPIIGPTEKPHPEEKENNKCFFNRLNLNAEGRYDILVGVGGHTTYFEHGDYYQSNMGFCLGKYNEEGGFDALTNAEVEVIMQKNNDSFSSSSGKEGWLRRSYPTFPSGGNSSTFWHTYVRGDMIGEIVPDLNSSYPDDSYNSDAIWQYYLDYSSRSFIYMLGADYCPTGYREIPNGMDWPVYLIEIRKSGNPNSNAKFNRNIDYCSRDTPINLTGPSKSQPLKEKKCKCKKRGKKMNCGCSCREIADIMARYLSRVANNHEQTRDKHTRDVEELAKFLQNQMLQTTPSAQDLQQDLSPILQKIDYLTSLLEQLKNTEQNLDLTPILQRLNEVEAFLWTGVKNA